MWIMYQLILVMYYAVHVGCVRPINVAVVVGQTVEMKCFAKNDTVKWKYNPYNSTGSDTPVEINSGGSYSPREGFSVTGKTLGQILVINNATLEHAGLYQCLFTGNKFEALLIVFDPVCKTTRDNDHMIMQCKISYSGNSAPPIIEWRRHGTGEIDGEIVDQGDITYPSNKTAISSINKTINSIAHNSSFSCKTNFNLSSTNYNEGNLTTNVTDNSYTWMSEVFYKPKFIRISPNNMESFSPGDTLNCSAEANPEPSYKWTHLRNSSDPVIRGPVLVIGETISDNISYTFECEADNKIGQPVKTNVTFKIQNKPSRSESSIGPVHEPSLENVTIGVLVPICFLIAILTIVIIIKKFGKECMTSLKKKNDQINVPDTKVHSGDEDFGCTDLGGVYFEIGQIPTTHGQEVCISRKPSTENKRMELVGDDGTTYCLMNAVNYSTGTKPRPPPPAIQPSMFDTCVYASIDHTKNVPPPPPPITERYRH